MSLAAIPEAATLVGLYDRGYFQGGEYRDYLREEPHLRRNFRRRLAVLARHAPSLRSGRLFDVGCAYGFFLDEARGHARHVSGIDVSAHAVQRAQRLGVRADVGDYLTFDLTEPHDAIVLWDTIEHLAHPDRVARKAAADLRPGGILAMTTGDASSLIARARGSAWRLFHPPTHLHYFTPEGITRLFAAHGFDTLSITHPGITRSVASMAESAFGLRCGQAIDPRWGMTINLRDVMLAIGRRR